MISNQYVLKRYQDFLARYKEVLMSFHYDENDINKQVNNLKNRLDNFDFKIYGDKPVDHLHAGKRLTRTYIRWVIQYAPARKAKIRKWQDDYHLYCKRERESNPFASFASFEAHYAKRLLINFSEKRKLFYI